MHKCEFCEREFEKVTGLKNHQDRVHTDLVVYEYRCEICGVGFNGLNHILAHISKKHKDIKVEDYYNQYIYGKLKCKYCGVVLPYDRFSGSFCNQQHYESYNRELKGLVNFECSICGAGYKKLGGLQLHLSKIHHFDNIQLEEYYRKHIWKEGEPDGKCLWCGKELTFTSFTDGYNKFCYNTECNVKWYNQNTTRKEDAAKSTKEVYEKHPEKLYTRPEYWMLKGFTEKDAIEIISKNQSTFTKEKCIEKLGEVEGLKRWQERQDTWQKTMNDKPIEEIERINRAKMGKKSFSKISQTLFWWIDELLNEKYKKIYFAEKKNEQNTFENNEFMVRTTNNTNRFLDFYIPKIKKCIEFDGDYWHDINTVGNVERDKIREEEIIDTIKDIQILHIKEKDYNDDPEKVINQCLEFLDAKTN